MDRFIAVDHSRCTGCKTCEMVCSLGHFGECNPGKSAIRVRRKEADGLVACVPVVCQQCDQPACVEACPTEALSREADRGVLAVDSDQCTGCELCAEACSVGGLRIDVDAKRAISCDLCGGQPECVPACHAQCLSEAGVSGASRDIGFERLLGVLESHGLAGGRCGRRET
jgi:Fe-S-cluster-containing hydrogenase component 2